MRVSGGFVHRQTNLIGSASQLEARMCQKMFPKDDPLYVATARAHNMVRDLNNALHYAQVREGVGR
jgi:hypothetical protein